MSLLISTGWPAPKTRNAFLHIEAYLGGRPMLRLPCKATIKCLCGFHETPIDAQKTPFIIQRKTEYKKQCIRAPSARGSDAGTRLLGRPKTPFAAITRNRTVTICALTMHHGNQSAQARTNFLRFLFCSLIKKFESLKL